MNDSDKIMHYLDALLRVSNFTKAAHNLYISQPYLTQLIKRIEDQLGTEIIDRNSSPYKLTAAGLLYYRYLEQSSKNKKDLEKELVRFTAPKDELIRIAILESLGTFLLPAILPKFLSENPNIKIQLLEDFPTQSEKHLLNDQVDCYIGQTPDTLGSEIEYTVNGGEKYFIVIPPSSKYFIKGQFILDQSTYTPKQLLEEPLVLSGPDSAIRHQVNGILQGEKVVPNIVLESKSVITATNLAINGLGLTVSSASIIKRIAQTPINLYPLDPQKGRIRYFIATKKGREISPALINLISIFKEANLEPDIR